MLYPMPGTNDQLATGLAELLGKHDLRTVRTRGPRSPWLARLLGAKPADRLAFPDHPGYWLSGRAFRNPSDHRLVAEMRIRFGLPDGRLLRQSFAVMGSDPAAQVVDGICRFATKSLPLLRTGLSIRAEDGPDGEEMWDIILALLQDYETPEELFLRTVGECWGVMSCFGPKILRRS